MAKKTIEEIQQEIVDEFTFFGDDWMEKYEYIIDLGKKLPLIDPSLKDEDHLIRGCQSQVWLEAAEKEGQIEFTADSDAVITKGLIALLVRTLSGQAPKEIAQANLYFIDKIGLQEHLSPTRSNGLRSMVKQMKLYGLAFAAKS
ncbi:MAG TPA: SufE family protein [Saprospiraceae bacterium]|nr:SufE family protein [Saprospiraceae bacterium]